MSVRAARRDDVDAIHRFGEAYIREHYAPLIGAEAADAQVVRWWGVDVVGAAVADGLVVVAEVDGVVVGVGQRGRRGSDHVVYKLYTHPEHRGRGLGTELLDALARAVTADRLFVEHFAANARAGAFYEREGFTVDRVEASSSGDPALDVVWRSRAMPYRRSSPR
ncbi:GNAT family N-acetyltransferase [Actinokineospora soli]|uniref:GNAT family N-acetyltransferase n=1 Tax=Actinokineospora soli TaxID=1048753 RepID=A0ABW2TRD1_9PSEU